MESNVVLLLSGWYYGRDTNSIEVQQLLLLVSRLAFALSLIAFASEKATTCGNILLLNLLPVKITKAEHHLLFYFKSF